MSPTRLPASWHLNQTFIQFEFLLADSFFGRTEAIPACAWMQTMHSKYDTLSDADDEPAAQRSLSMIERAYANSRILHNAFRVHLTVRRARSAMTARQAQLELPIRIGPIRPPPHVCVITVGHRKCLDDSACSPRVVPLMWHGLLPSVCAWARGDFSWVAGHRNSRVSLKIA